MLEIPFNAQPRKNKLFSCDLAEIEEAKYHFRVKKMEVFNRALYVYQCIAKAFDIELPGWGVEDILHRSFDDLENWETWDSEGNPIQNYCSRYDSELIGSVNGNPWNFSSGSFPVRWLFEDFEKELADGIEAYKEILLKQKLEKEQRKKIIKEIKKKLTKEEIKIVFPLS